MKRAAVVSVLVVLASAASAADRPPPDLVAARAAFAAAVAKNDMAAAAALSSFPLKNVAYRAPKTIPQAQFAAQFRMYRQFGDCVKSAPLLPTPAEGAAPAIWKIDCDGHDLWFGLRNGRWLHTGYENVNE